MSSKRKLFVLVAVTLGCMTLPRAYGWGFRHETWLTERFGWTLFGSDVYMGVWFIFMMMPLVAILIPALVVHRVFGESLRDYGLTLGDSRAGAMALLAAVPAYATLPLLSSHFGTEYYYDYLAMPEFVRPWQIAVHFVSYAPMMLGYEFLFRGFLMLGVARTLGDTPRARFTALAISVALSTLFFAGTPWVFLATFPVLAILGGWLTFRTRSVLYFAFINWQLGIWSDAWEIVKLNATAP